MRRPHRTVRNTLLLLVGLIVGSILFVQTAPPAQPRRFTASFLTPHYVSHQLSCQSYWPIPSPCLFHIYDSGYTVSSATWADLGVLGNETANGDYDYMLAYADQDTVYLPGGSWNVYTYLGASYASGSGWILHFLTPTGYHFAFLHMSIVYAIAAHPRGGDRVGLSGWPSSLQYSNNSCWDAITCKADSHLCLVLADGARSWFFYIASGRNTAPKIVRHVRQVFPARKWGYWARSHHKPVPAYRIHGKLMLTPTRWWHGHQTGWGCPMRTARWLQRQRVMRQRFTRGFLYTWSRFRGAPFKFVRKK